MNNSILTKAKALVLALTTSSVSFGQLNNCINTKEHPLIVEIIESVKANPNYRSLLSYAIIKGDKIGLARSTILNLAYAWAACKRIMDLNQRKDEEFKYLEIILNEREFKALIAFLEKRQICDAAGGIL